MNFCLTPSSCVLLNGIAGTPIPHVRGLRQGDPLSHLLFVMTTGPVNHVLEHATTIGLQIRASLCAGNAAIFVSVTKDDVSKLALILHHFGIVMGLVTNC